MSAVKKSTASKVAQLIADIKIYWKFIDIRKLERNDATLMFATLYSYVDGIVNERNDHCDIAITKYKNIPQSKYMCIWVHI